MVVYERRVYAERGVDGSVNVGGLCVGWIYGWRAHNVNFRVKVEGVGLREHGNLMVEK